MRTAVRAGRPNAAPRDRERAAQPRSMLVAGDSRQRDRPADLRSADRLRPQRGTRRGAGGGRSDARERRDLGRWFDRRLSPAARRALARRHAVHRRRRARVVSGRDGPAQHRAVASRLRRRRRRRGARPLYRALSAQAAVRAVRGHRLRGKRRAVLSRSGPPVARRNAGAVAARLGTGRHRPVPAGALGARRPHGAGRQRRLLERQAGDPAHRPSLHPRRELAAGRPCAPARSTGYW